MKHLYKARTLTLRTLSVLVLVAMLAALSPPSLPALSVAYAQEQAPGVPAPSITATANTVVLSWPAVADADSYEIQRWDSAGGWLSAQINQPETSYTDSNVTLGTTYTYYVRARNAAGTSASWGTASATPTTPALTLPGMPEPTATATANTIELSWPAVADADSYEIQRWDSVGGWLSPQINQPETSYTDSDVTLGTTYTYYVRARNAAGTSALWGTVSATPTTPAEPTMPGPPQNLMATPGNGEVTLMWDEPADTGGAAITRYDYRSYLTGGTAPETWEDAGTALTATVSGLTNGMSYTFEVRAVNSVDPGTAVTGTATPMADAAPMTPPSVPLNLVATRGYKQITLTWDAPADDGGSPITGYDIEVYADGAWGAETSVPASVTSYTDTRLDDGTTYDYRVLAKNATGKGDPTASESATTQLTGPIVPTNPRALTAVADASDEAEVSKITLTWQAPEYNGGATITAYEYRYMQEGESWTRWLDAGLDFTEEVSDLTPAVSYTFEVVARNSEGQGTTASETETSPTTAPTAAPSAFTAEFDSTSAPTTKVTLRWRKLRDDQLGGFPNANVDTPDITYEIQFKDIDGDDYVGPITTGLMDIALQSGSTLYFQTEHMPPADTFGAGRTFNYQVRATNAKGDGPWSSERSVSTDAAVPDMPLNLVATPSLMQITITWDKPVHDGGSPLLHYDLHVYSTDATTVTPPDQDTPTNQITELELPATRSSFEHTGLDVDRRYYYRIRAVNNVGDGVFTAWPTDDNDPDTVEGTAVPTEIVDGSPTAVTLFEVSGPTATTLTITWMPPTTIGNSPISGYQLQRRAGDSTDIHDFEDVAGSPLGPTATMYTDKDLMPATSYDYRVRALNGSGPGPWEDTTPTSTSDATSPDPPGLTAEAAGPTSIMLTWTAPESDNGSPITGYQLQRRTGDDSFVDVTTNVPLETAARQYTDDTGLAPGMEYEYQIRAKTGDGMIDGEQGTWSDADSAMTAAGIPEEPTDVSAAPTDDTDDDDSESTSLTLMWMVPANDHGREITGYRIDRWAYYAASNSWDWAFLADDAAADATSYADNDNDEDLMPNTRYFYRVRAKTGDGTVEAEQGKWSEWASGLTSPGQPTAPGALTAVVAGPNSIMLTWTAPESDNGTPIIGYHLQRQSPAGGDDYTAVETNIPLGSSRYTDTDLMVGTEYEYQIRANTDDANLQGVYSAAASATTVKGVPAAPTFDSDSVVPTTDSESTSLTLTWTWAAENAATERTITGFRIDRWAFNTASSSWGWEFVADAADDARSYINGGRIPNTTYNYRVRAKTGDGRTDAEQGAWSTWTSGRTAPGVPAAPMLSAVTGGMKEIRLSWTAPAANGRTITGYHIQRYNPGVAMPWDGEEDQIVVAASLTAWNDSDLEPGTPYYYRIRAETGTGTMEDEQGDWSSTANAMTVSSVPGRPDMIVDLDADPPLPVATSTSVTLTWTAPTSDGGARLTGYHVQRWSSAGWQIISSGLVEDATYVDMDVTPETTYYYRVRAVNTNGEGLWSTPFVRVATPE